MIADIRYALRQLFKAPGFAAIVVLTLALGIGACTAIFSVVNGVVLKPLPYADAGRVMQIGEVDTPNARPVGGSVSPVNYQDWRAQSTVFSGLAAYRGAGFTLTGLGDAVRVTGLRVSADFFRVLGISPQLGRDFTAEDDQPGRNVVLVSHAFWQRYLGGAPDATSRTLLLSGESYTILGVMPESLSRATTAEIWRPMAFTAEELAPNNRGSHYVNVVGRLKPGVSLEQARSEMDTIARRLAEQFPATNKGALISVLPQLDYVVGRTKPVLFALLGAVGALLLIAIANVANLLLARATTRVREVSVRAALGASRVRIVRQLLTESLVLAIAGGAIGVLFAYWGLEALLALAPEALPRTTEIAIDTPVLATTAALVILAGLAFGVAPALQSSRVDLVSALKSGGRAGGAGRGGLRNALVVTQIALALVLLTAAGLLMRSFARLQAVDPGFDPTHTYLVAVNAPSAKYRTAAAHHELADKFHARFRALPGVTAVGAINMAPLAGNENVFSFTIEGRAPFPEGEEPSATFYASTPGYFAALGIPLVRGRDFTAQDQPTSTRVVIINQAFADRFFPGEDPIGRRISIANGTNGWREIVGIARDVKHNELTDARQLQFYEPFTQYTSGNLNYIVRSERADPGLPAALRAAVREIDAEIPVMRLMRVEELLANSLARQRFGMTLFAVFSGLALLLAAIGIYGVMAYTVSQRTAEFGVRMALGAQAADVRRLVLGQSLRLAALGLAVGLALTLVGARLIESLLFELSARDPLTLGAIVLVLGAVALVAGWIPARRAARVDPIIALRAE